MSSLTLSELPSDIQVLICSHTAAISPKFLRALAQVNRSYHNAATAFLYRGLTIQIDLRAHLARDVDTLRNSDVGRIYLQCARRLEIAGRIPSSQWDEEKGWKKPYSQGFRNADNDVGQEPLQPRFDEVFVCDGDREKKDDVAAAWKPLVSLIADFKHLSDVIYSCQGQFPPGLLDAIQTHHPKCKLHLRRFRFLSLHDAETDPDELALATSSNLYSLSSLNTYRDSNGVDDFNKEAMMRVVTAAPKLKHVRVLGARPASSAALYSARKRDRGHWQGFSPPVERSEKAHLLSLSFCTYEDRLSDVKLHKWNELTDFSKLQEFSCGIKDSKVLMELTINDMLPSLRVLRLTLERAKTDEGFKEVVESFFGSLRPLEILRLSGTLHKELVTRICEQHGSNLKELALNPYEDFYDMAGPPMELHADDMVVIARNCPHLTDLRLTVRRSMSNREETQCYEAIGEIKTLKRLNIHLNCTNPSRPPPAKPDWDEFEMQQTADKNSYPRYYYGTYKYAIVNSAVDETLARSIWDAASGDSPDAKLESLTLTSGGGSGFGNSHPGDLMTVVDNLSRSFKLTRFANGEDDTELTVVELNKDRREKNDERQRKNEQGRLEKWGHRGLNDHAYKVFEHLWPFQEEQRDWREVWHSWPLQRSKQPTQ